MIQALKAFVAVAAEGSFAGAARRLEIDEAAIGEHVRALEARYDLTLFEHAGDGPRLTAAGRIFYEQGGRVLTAVDDLERSLQALKDGTGGVLEVATSPIPGEAVLPLLLPRFRQLRPDVQVRETVGDVRSMVDRLLRREVELAVIGGPFHDDRLEAAFFARDELALIARRDHPLATQGPLRARDVCRYPLVLRGEGSGARVAVESALLAAGVERGSIQVAAELGSTEAVKRAVEAGLGVAFVSVCTLEAAGPAGDLRALPLADEPPARDLLVVTERGRRLTALAATFRDFLLSDETLREVAAHTRLPKSLRPGSGGPAVEPRRPDEPRVAPPTGLEHDPLLPPRWSGMVVYRLAREPRSPDEERVVRILTRQPGCTRAELLEHLSNELRRQEGDPLSRAPDIGVFRLELYDEAADVMLEQMVGDLLVESDDSTDAR